MKQSCLYMVVPLAIFVFFSGTYHATAQTATHMPRLSIENAPAAPHREVSVAATVPAGYRNPAIRWFVDDTEYTEFENARRVSFQTKKIGESQTVRAEITPSGDDTVVATLNVVPASIDIIIEADTTTPVFYTGRALPGPGSRVRVHALPFIENPSLRAGEYAYRWKLDNKTLFGGLVLGKSTAEVILPFSNRALLSVEVMSRAGAVLARKTVTITAADSEVHFYEVNPLRGMGRRALGDRYTLLSPETTLTAQPYFMNQEVLLGQGAISWRIDGKKTNPGMSDPTRITLRTVAGQGRSAVSFSITNTRSVTQRAEKNLQVHFR